MKIPPAAAVAGLFLSIALPAAAQPTARSDAVVFIRVFANASIENETIRKRAALRDLEVTTGSGFIVSPAGYVLTNEHVIRVENQTVEIDGREIEIRMAIARIEVLLASGERHEGSVVASDPDLDLAVIAIPGAGGLPYVPFGDSDPIDRGTSVTALGYPFGRSVDVGRQKTGDVVPQATITPGTVSAVRNGDDEQPRFLQVTNALNPGTSGGPIIDDEGYALGVVVMKVTKADSIGFAIAINRAKDFLERAGLDSALPSRRLALGPPASLPEKGLRLQMLQGFQDSLPGRLRVEASDQGVSPVALRIRRVASHAAVDRIEAELLSGRLFGQGPFEPVGNSRQAAKEQVSGRAVRTGQDRIQWTMEYRLLGIGGEWVAAEYTAPSELAAFNRGALRASLASIEASRLLVGNPRRPRWRPSYPLPEGWIAEPAEAASEDAASSSPEVFVVTSPEDFTISARYIGWDGASTPAIVMRAEASADGSYRRLWSVADVGYICLGQVLAADRGALQIEFVGPREREASLAQWLRQWRAALEVK
jgi:Trypsin-like peptidase domain